MVRVPLKLQKKKVKTWVRPGASQSEATKKSINLYVHLNYTVYMKRDKRDHLKIVHGGLSWWSSGKTQAPNVETPRFNPWVGN